MVPKLTSGSIDRILNGEDVSGAVMQILGYKKISDTDDCYRLLITDGVTGFPFFILNTPLNYLVTNKELEKFTIVRVDNYICDHLDEGQKVIILLNLTILTPGANIVSISKEDVSVMLGNPKTSSVPSSNTANGINTLHSTRYECSQRVIMLPRLTSGSICHILSGEYVSGAVMQILDCVKILNNDRYKLLISDGVTSYPFTMLGTQLNDLVTNKELEIFSIVRVDKYACHQAKPDRKIIMLLNLTVLTPGADVGKKLGTPENPYAAPSTSVNRTKTSSNVSSRSAFSTNTEPKTIPTDLTDASSNSQPKPTFSVDAGTKTLTTNRLNTCNKSNSKLAFPVNVKTKLTSGSINRILSGEDVSGAIMQILDYKKILGTGNDGYRLLISDGVTGYPFTILGTQLNDLVTNKELEKFTIVRVDKCVCNQVQPDRKVIILLNLNVLTPGADVGEKLVTPVNANAAPSTTVYRTKTSSNVSSRSAFSTNTEPKTIPTDGTDASSNSQPKPTFSIDASTKTLTTNRLNTCNKSNSKLAFPVNVKTKLTSGSINRILSGEDVSGAVMQILDYKKIPCTGNDHYRLFISDGVTSYPLAMLCPQLNVLVANKELEKFAIVRVNKCVCNQKQPDQKIIILLNLTVLTPGADIGGKLVALPNANAAPAATVNRTEISSNVSSKSAFTTNTETKAIPTNETDASSQSKPTFSVDADTKTLTTNRLNTCNKNNSKLAFSVNTEAKYLAKNSSDISNLTVLNPDANEKPDNHEVISSISRNSTTSSNIPYVCSTQLTDLIISLLQR